MPVKKQRVQKVRSAENRQKMLNARKKVKNLNTRVRTVGMDNSTRKSRASINAADREFNREMASLRAETAGYALKNAEADLRHKIAQKKKRGDYYAPKKK